MPETKDINNNFKTETILDMRSHELAVEFVKKLDCSKAIKIIILEQLNERFKQGGVSKLRYEIKKYEAWLEQLK